MKRSAVLFIGLMLLVSCASTGKKKAGEVTHPKGGFLEGYYEKLGPGPEDGAKLRWLKPGVDFSKYEEFMIDSVVFFLADAGIDDFFGVRPYQFGSVEFAAGDNV